MVLAVDIGNTNVFVGCFENNEISFVERLSTNKNSTSLEYLVLIKTVLEIHRLNSDVLDGSIISSVVPSVTARVKEAVEKLTGKAPFIVGPGVKSGLKIKLDNPLQLGSDRVADAVAATNLYPCPLIIVDMGTATRENREGINSDFVNWRTLIYIACHETICETKNGDRIRCLEQCICDSFTNEDVA